MIGISYAKIGKLLRSRKASLRWEFFNAEEAEFFAKSAEFFTSATVLKVCV